MDFRDHITTETSAFADRLIAAAEAAVDRTRTEGEGRIAALRSEIDEVRARLDAEIARAEALTAQIDAESSRAASRIAELERRAAALESDAEVAAAALHTAEEGRARAEASVEASATELRSLREMLESARTEAIRTFEALEAEGAQRALLQEAHETTVTDLQARLDAAAAATTALEAALADTRREAREAASAADAQVQQLRERIDEQAEALQKKDTQLAEAESQGREAAAAANGQLLELQRRLDEHAETVRQKDTQLEAARTAVTRARAQMTDANAISDAASAEMTVLRNRVKHVTSLLAAAGTSLEGLGTAKSVAELFAALVRELATEFARVAIFQVKGNHLEGELAVGLDDSVDIQKIVVPRSLSSLLTRAAAGDGVQQATKEEIGESRPPFGGSPQFVIAAPLVFEGEVLAVVYADSDAALSEAHPAFATLLVRHANLALALHAQEVRTSSQLRDYARTLLTEVEAMFAADARLPEPERVKRLSDNIGFARDLYAQRAALEGPAVANLLEDEIGRMTRGADPAVAFPYALATWIHQSQDLRRAGAAR